MQNINLSANVQQYFVHALKGIGILDQAGEMSEQNIAQLLAAPNTSFHDVYYLIRTAVLRQLQTDASTEKSLPNNTAFDRQTVKSIFANNTIRTTFGNLQLGDQECDTFMNNLTSPVQRPVAYSLDHATEMVIGTLMAGVVDQKLNKDEKTEACAVWNELYRLGYKNWLINETGTFQPNLPYEQQQPTFQTYLQEKLRLDLLNETAAHCGGDVQLANEVLNSKIDAEAMNKLAANGKLLKLSRQFCAERGRNPETDLTALDVLSVLSTEGASAQVITYFQTRSKQQQTDLQQNPRTTTVTKQNKIGNIMGNSGRKAVKAATGSGAVVDFDTVKLKKGKEGPWRGYKDLYDRIFKFLSSVYENIPSIGFVQQIMERNGTPIGQPTGAQKIKHDAQDLVKAWQTNYEAMPEIYQTATNGNSTTEPALNVAGEFYNKTKARLLADKMRLLNCTAVINDDFERTDPNLPRLEQQVAYLQQRIQTAEQVLKQRMPKSTDSTFNNPRYFAMLESQILAENANRQNAGAQAFLNNTKNFSANDEMLDALHQFNLAAHGNTTNRQNAKRAMAVELFHLQNQVNDGVITNQDLDDMTDRFIRSNTLNQLCEDLMQLSPQGQQKASDNAQPQNSYVPFNSQDYQITAVDTNAAINQFVEKDLQQNAAKAQYNAHQANLNRSKILDAVIAER